jgi:superfamily II DNA helicase RecQ
MQLKLFILSVKNLTAAEAEMNAFLRSHRVLAVKKEFVSDGENSFWTFCVEYLESTPAGNLPPGGKLPKVDYKEVLKPEEFEVFSRLRDWRKTVAEKEGVPVYVVFSNEQLAEMVKKKVGSKAALKEIEGVGDARVEKYGDAVLERLVFNPVTG